jgi:LPS-assembly protein
LAYSLSIGQGDRQNIPSQNPKRILPILDIDGGLIFERDLLIKHEPYIQTLEPRLYYLYVPYRNQNSLPNFDTGNQGFDFNQLFRDNRFTGFDRLGDANQITFALSSRFLTERTGRERLSMTIGQILYFKDRCVTLCHNTNDPLCLEREIPNHRNHHSSLVGLARYAIQEDWSISANMEWDPYKNHSDKEMLMLQYQPNDLAVVNLGYQFLRRNPVKFDPVTGLPERLDQTDTSIAWPLTERWRILGRWHYDLHNHRSNEVSMGFEQQGCCTAIRFYLSRFLLPFDNKIVIDPLQPKRTRYTNALFIQFVFKGFASAGNRKIDQTVKQAIPGYQWHGEDF